MINGITDRTVIVMSGVSGSGKSTVADRWGADWMQQHPASHYYIVSADDYFMIESESGGLEYHFDASKLTPAHANCFRRFLGALERGTPLVMVDNTNTTVEEIAPYMLGAEAYGYQPMLHTIACFTKEEVKVCAARNSHGVPEQVVMAQQRRLQERRVPYRWRTYSSGVQT